MGLAAEGHLDVDALRERVQSIESRLHDAIDGDARVAGRPAPPRHRSAQGTARDRRRHRRRDRGDRRRLHPARDRLAAPCPRLGAARRRTGAHHARGVSAARDPGAPLRHRLGRDRRRVHPHVQRARLEGDARRVAPAGAAAEGSRGRRGARGRVPPAGCPAAQGRPRRGRSSATATRCGSTATTDAMSTRRTSCSRSGRSRTARASGSRMPASRSTTAATSRSTTTACRTSATSTSPVTSRASSRCRRWRRCRAARSPSTSWGSTSRAHRHLDYEKAASAIFTEPEIADVGLAEAEAFASGRKIRVTKVPFSANAKALIKGDPRGFVKILSDPATGVVLGGSIVGRNAAELISVIARRRHQRPQGRPTSSTRCSCTPRSPRPSPTPLLTRRPTRRRDPSASSDASELGALGARTVTAVPPRVTRSPRRWTDTPPPRAEIWWPTSSSRPRRAAQNGRERAVGGAGDRVLVDAVARAEAARHEVGVGVGGPRAR